MKQLRIVYVWDADYPWDVRVEKTCKSLVEAGHEVHIVARNKLWSARYEKLPEGTVHRMRPWKLVGRNVDALLSFPVFFSPRWLALIWSAVRRSSADVILVRDLPLCPSGLFIGSLTGVPVILDMAEDYPAMMHAIRTAGRARWYDLLVRNPRAAEFVEQFCLRRVAELWVVSDHLRTELSRTVEPQLITVVGNTPPQANTYVEVPRPPRDWLEVVYLGLLEVPRGIMELIDATRTLRDRGISIRLRLIGSGRDEQLFRDRAAELGLDDSSVEFLGHVPYRDALRIVAAADIGAMPLHRNDHMDSTIPNKIFDYMSVGVPVLTSDVTASAALVRQLDVGEVFTSSDVDSLAAAIERLVPEATRERMAANGRVAVRKVYNWECDSSRLLASVDRVASANGVRAPE